jgi:hypothetical protein
MFSEERWVPGIYLFQCEIFSAQSNSYQSGVPVRALFRRHLLLAASELEADLYNQVALPS